MEDCSAVDSTVESVESEFWMLFWPYNVVVDECFKFSLTMLLNSTIMLVIVLHYASICSYASILLLCSKLCRHNSPRPNTGEVWGRAPPEKFRF